MIVILDVDFLSHILWKFCIKILKPSANEDVFLFCSFLFVQKTVMIHDLINPDSLRLFIFGSFVSKLVRFVIKSLSEHSLGFTVNSNRDRPFELLSCLERQLG